MDQKICEYAAKTNYEATHRESAHEIGHNSHATVHRCLKKRGWRITWRKSKPLLKEKHIQQRIKFCEEQKLCKFRNWVDIDEKYFFHKRIGKRLQHPPHVTPEAALFQSTSHIPKVLVLSAIARPDPLHNFDGKIGIWRVSETCVAKNNSKNRAKGTTYEKTVSMNAEIFRKMMQNKVIPAIREKMKWYKQINVQMDNASPHVGKNNVDFLKKEFQKFRKKPKIVLKTQPPQSPDTNCNDLGFFNSLQIDVEKPRR
jgi:hypothetical protein